MKKLSVGIVFDDSLDSTDGVSQQVRLANLTTDYAATPSTPRNMYTCIGACTAGSKLSDTPFATTNTYLTEATLGITVTKPGRGIRIDRVDPDELASTGRAVPTPGDGAKTFQLVQRDAHSERLSHDCESMSDSIGCA